MKMILPQYHGKELMRAVFKNLKFLFMQIYRTL